MSQVKLTYFDLRARGELARLVMAAAKKSFEDVRVQFEDWPALKEKTVYGTLPILNVGGVDYFQGNAICTYLARENGLYGKTNLDGLKIDQVVDLKEDLVQAEAKVMFGTEESKAEAAKSLTESVYPRMFKIFVHCLNLNKNGFVAGDQLSLGDLAIYEAIQVCFQNNPKFLDSYKELLALRSKVEGAPGLKEYLAKRKVTPI